jgi:hypothetical protein
MTLFTAEGLLRGRKSGTGSKFPSSSAFDCAALTHGHPDGAETPEEWDERYPGW